MSHLVKVKKCGLVIVYAIFSRGSYPYEKVYTIFGNSSTKKKRGMLTKQAMHPPAKEQSLTAVDLKSS